MHFGIEPKSASVPCALHAANATPMSQQELWPKLEVSSYQVSVSMHLFKLNGRASARTRGSSIATKQQGKEEQVEHQNFGSGAQPVAALSVTAFAMSTTL